METFILKSQKQNSEWYIWYSNLTLEQQSLVKNLLSISSIDSLIIEAILLDRKNNLSFLTSEKFLYHSIRTMKGCLTFERRILNPFIQINGLDIVNCTLKYQAVVMDNPKQFYWKLFEDMSGALNNSFKFDILVGSIDYFDVDNGLFHIIGFCIWFEYYCRIINSWFKDSRLEEFLADKVTKLYQTWLELGGEEEKFITRYADTCQGDAHSKFTTYSNKKLLGGLDKICVSNDQWRWGKLDTEDGTIIYLKTPIGDFQSKIKLEQHTPYIKSGNNPNFSHRYGNDTYIDEPSMTFFTANNHIKSATKI